jgi:hypothetical protein
MAGQDQTSTVGIDGSEAWRQVAPEEKVEMLNRAHAVGVIAAFVSIVILSTIAVAFKTSAIMWGSLIIAPLIFQYAAGKAWRGLKPRVMLEYLAARSAARRFAFSQGSKDLHLQLLFRGKLTQERKDIQEALEAAVKNLEETETWVALFRDTIVMINERPGGAGLAFGHEINDRIQIQSSDTGGYSNDKEINIQAKDRLGAALSLKLTSKYPAALAVFEKLVLQLQNEIRKSGGPEQLSEPAATEEENDFKTYQG